MDNTQGLQKLNFLIKELNDTHERLQAARDEFKEIEAALLNQQILILYQHIQQLLPLLKKHATLEENFEPTAPNNKPVNKSLSEFTGETRVYKEPKPLNKEKPAIAIPISESKKPESIEENEISESNSEAEEPAFIQEEIVSAPSLIPEGLSHNQRSEIISDETELSTKNEIVENNRLEELVDQELKLSIDETPIRQKEEDPLGEIKKVKKQEDSSAIINKVNTVEPSLNERYAGNVKPNLADRLTQTPIKDLRTAIGLNQKIAIIKALFQGNDQEFKNAIAVINNFRNLTEARTFMLTELASKYKWDEDSVVVQEFTQIVNRRFL